MWVGIKQWARETIFHPLGIEIHRYAGDTAPSPFPEDFDPAIIPTVLSVRPYTLTSNERVYSLCQAVEYLVRHQVPGSIVECGVYQGGSMMAVAETLRRLGDTERKLYLYDTFEGMPCPSEKDIGMGRFRYDWQAVWQAGKKEGGLSDWLSCPLDVVKDVITRTGYPTKNIQYVKGLVQNTIPETLPESIALLRLDTDYYDSTRHELVHLFPRLVQGGVVILDDYNSWQGARQAVDEYFAEHRIRIFLHRIDDEGCIGIKQ